MAMTTHTPLQPTQVDFYHENGYLLPKSPMFPQEKFQVLFDLFETLLAEKGNKRGNELDVPHFFEPRLFDFLMADEVLDVVEQLIGKNIGLWSSHFICKEPMKGRRTPWHEDSAYWNGRFDRYDGIVTVWLAIDPSNLSNGCMGVIPQSHRNGFSEYADVKNPEQNIFAEEIKEDSIDASKAVWFELEQNQYSLHDSRIIHGANANTGTQRRTGYTMRYFDTGMKLQEHPSNNEHKIYHCRGENPGNNPLVYL